MKSRTNRDRDKSLLSVLFSFFQVNLNLNLCPVLIPLHLCVIRVKPQTLFHNSNYWNDWVLFLITQWWFSVENFNNKPSSFLILSYSVCKSESFLLPNQLIHVVPEFDSWTIKPHPFNSVTWGYSFTQKHLPSGRRCCMWIVFGEVQYIYVD